jgi:YjbE family integral membrane protein
MRVSACRRAGPHQGAEPPMGFDPASFVQYLFGSYWPYALPILQIIWIDLILSGDNAVVIALACRNLPLHLRKWGIILGAGVAIGLRILFAGMITQLLAIPYLKLIGGILLLWIAIKLLLGEEESEGDQGIASHDKLWRAVMTIAMADVLMSLDNVIAVAAAAKGSVALIAFGIVLSIPLIIYGSTLILGLISRFPIFIWIGSLLLGWISGELIAHEKAIAPQVEQLAAAMGITLGMLYYLAAAAGALLVLVVGWTLRRRRHATQAH